MARILVIDDDSEIRLLVRHILEKDNHEVTEAIDSEEGIQAFEQNTPDLVITDIFMPGRDGHGTIEKLTREHPGVKIIAMTGHGTAKNNEYLRIAESLGARQTLSKPFTVKDVQQAVLAVLGTDT